MEPNKAKASHAHDPSPSEPVPILSGFRTVAKSERYGEAEPIKVLFLN